MFHWTPLRRPALCLREESGSMKTAIASYLSLSARLLACAALAQLLACKSQNPSTADGGVGTTIDSCAPNVGNTSGNAVTIAAGQSYAAKICYEGTSNWFVTTV